ncbi:MAG TPA: DUF6597 domain-containing transcriptional factor [Thermoanaerobaculia bacterium]
MPTCNASNYEATVGFRNARCSFVSHTPGHPIGDFVDCFWLCVDGQSHRKERILPTGTIELIVNLRDDEVRITIAYRPARSRFSAHRRAGSRTRTQICQSCGDHQASASFAGSTSRGGGARHVRTGPRRNIGTTCCSWRRHAGISIIRISSATSRNSRA